MEAYHHLTTLTTSEYLNHTCRTMTCIIVNSNNYYATLTSTPAPPNRLRHSGSDLIVGEQSITREVLRRRLALIIHTTPKESPNKHPTQHSFRHGNRSIVILLNISTSENHHHAVTPTQQRNFTKNFKSSIK